MASRYVAKPIRPTTGLVRNDHSITLSDGSTQRIFRKGSVKGERAQVRNYEIKDAKRRILNRIPLQERRIRGAMVRAIDTFELELLKLERLGGRDRQGQLKVVEKSRLLLTCNKLAKNKVKELKSIVQSEIEASVKTYMIGVRRSIPNKDDLSLQQINEIAKRKAKEIMMSKVAGKSANQRMNRYSLKIRDELMKHAEFNQVERIKRLRQVKKKLVDPKNSQKSCVARGVARLSRTEQNRAMHEAVLEYMVKNDYKFAYWRLSNAHKFYGGSEVCEVLATNTGDGVSTALTTSGASLDTAGLYLSDAYPTIPHANCMCSVEPIFI
jgi:hypothetical protein